jgi:hypothetical protein
MTFTIFLTLILLTKKSKKTNIELNYFFHKNVFNNSACFSTGGTMMSCIEAIRQVIDELPADALFTSRDLVQFGYRSAVDQSVSRLLKSQFITRVARGVFIKFGALQPSAYEVAKTKAKSFGRELVTHGKTIAAELNLMPTEPQDESQQPLPIEQIQKGEPELIFHITGRSSSFIYGKRRVYLHGSCQRILHHGETESGRLIRALWFIGKKWGINEIERLLSESTTETLTELLKNAAWMPGWLSHQMRLVCEIHNNNKIVTV